MSESRDIRRRRKGLRSQDRHERAEAAIRVGEAGDRSAIGEITTLSHDPDDLVAVSALYARWRLDGRIGSIERLIAALASRDEETMQLAVQALCGIGEAAVTDLVKALEGDSPYKVQIVRALGEIGGARAIEAVKRAAEAGDPKTRREAREVLSMLEG